MKNKRKKESAAGRLFYTFGTILLISVLIICTINFIKDSRALVKSETQATVPADASSGK